MDENREDLDKLYRRTDQLEELLRDVVTDLTVKTEALSTQRFRIEALEGKVRALTQTSPVEGHTQEEADQLWR